MLTTNNKRERYIKTLISQILNLSEDIFQTVKLSLPPEWLTSDMTVAQLRVLLLLHTEGQSRMSSIASNLGIAVSTVTGITDNLVKKELVIRQDDPEDRRVVICSLSMKGQKIMNRIWIQGQLQMKKLLNGLSAEQLEKAKEVAEILLLNAKAQSSNSTKIVNELS